MIKRKILLYILAILFIMMAFMPITTLEISNNGTMKYIFFMNHDPNFSIRWKHSVEDEDWEEFFRIEQGTIYLESTRFKTFGAGVPNDVGTGSYLKDGWVYMVHIHRFIGELDLLAGNDTNHRVIVHQKKWVLSHPNEQVPYHFKAKKMPLAIWLIESLLNNLSR